MQKSPKKSAIFPGDGNRYVRHIGSETAVYNTIEKLGLGREKLKIRK